MFGDVYLFLRSILIPFYHSENKAGQKQQPFLASGVVNIMTKSSPGSNSAVFCSPVTHFGKVKKPPGKQRTSLSFVPDPFDFIHLSGSGLCFSFTWTFLIKKYHMEFCAGRGWNTTKWY